MSFAAGQYTATLGGSALGQVQDGIRIEHQVYKEYIVGDNFARARQTAVFQGMDVFVGYTLMEYDAAAAANAIWPYGTVYLTMNTVISTLDSANADQLVLTALAGTPAAAVAGPATITMPLCILSEGFPVELLLRPQLRTLPVRQDVYPNSSGVFGTLT